MAVDIQKCRSSKNYHEGNAVTIPGVTSLPSSSDRQFFIVARGNQNMDWSAYDVILDNVGNKLAYYYIGT